MINKCIRFIYYNVALALLFQTLCSTTSFGSELSPEVLTAIRENQKTVDWVGTFHVTTKRTDHIKREQSSRNLYVVQEVWYDGHHIRTDVKDSKFIGENTTDLVLKKYPDGGKRVFQPPQIGSLEIYSNESWLDFYGDKFVYIHPYKWDKAKIINRSPILKYQMYKIKTLQELVLESAQLGYIFSAQPDSLNGEECILLSCNYPYNDGVTKVWVVPAKGYCIKKMQDMISGKIIYEYVTTLRQYSPGHWWFDSVIHKRWKLQEENPYETIELSIETIKFNEPLDPEVFTIAGTNIPLGTIIRDKISGLDYVYGRTQVFGTETDLALDALEDAIRDNTDSIEPKESIEPATTSVDEASPNREELTPPGLMVQTDSARDSGSRWPVLFVGTGIGLIIMLFVYFFFLKGKTKP